MYNHLYHNVQCNMFSIIIFLVLHLEEQDVNLNGDSIK